jgi:radical SAM superfamily enzyme YgiQ (UPF0313 family)
MLKEKEMLKIGLMTHGMAITERARQVIHGEDDNPLTLADYSSTSGVSMDLGDNVWINAPISDFNPNFVGSSVQYTLDHDGSVFLLRNGSLEVEAKPVPVPAYHDQNNVKGEPYTSFGITHTDRVRISPIEGCANNCQFCDMSFRYEYRKKSAQELVESVRVALTDPRLPARHVMISGGTPKLEDYDYQREVYQAVVSAFPDVPVDVMMTPNPSLLDARWLHELGVNALSVNLELYNKELAGRVMPKKNRVSREDYLAFVEGARGLFGEGKVRSILMVGLEPLEDTIRGVEALAQRGCDPVLSVFRPDPITPMGAQSPPTEEFLVKLYERAREVVDKYPDVKLGPRCIPCTHNTLTLPDNSGKYQ